MPRKRTGKSPGRPTLDPAYRREQLVLFVYPRTEKAIRKAAKTWDCQPGAFLDSVVELLTGFETEDIEAQPEREAS